MKRVTRKPPRDCWVDRCPTLTAQSTMGSRRLYVNAGDTPYDRIQVRDRRPNLQHRVLIGRLFEMGKCVNTLEGVDNRLR